jgi:asparagine N-glycosylation enzyme membrane subunit Stt3
MSSASARAGLVIFFLSACLRLLNLPFTAIAPADELYHWKRIEFSAQHFPQVLERDPDRGVDGAFCPWPPLYDLSAGLIARIFGMRVVPFIPPLAGALAAALATMWIFRRSGALAAWSAGIALASSPFIVTQSWVGSIDHHFLEWPLVLLIIVTMDSRGRLSSTSAMCAALFVQTALIIACGLAFIFAKRKDAFFVAAIVVAIYRATRTPGYPNSAWFLGWPHVILLVAAGVALAVRPRALGLAIGIAIAVPLCGTPVMQGLHFFGGDRWLQSIVEFQPMWKSPPASLISQIVGLGAGALLVWRKRTPLSWFAIAFLILTIINRRFWSISIPLLAIAGAIAAASIAQKHLRIAAVAAIALIPALQLAAWMRYPQPPVARYQQAWIDAANFLRSQPQGRVLAPWAMGHSFDVIGKHPVIVDGFGTMPDEALFWRASAAMQSKTPEELARNCDAMHVRYVAWYQLAPHPGFANPRELFREIYRSDPSFNLASVVILERAGAP